MVPVGRDRSDPYVTLPVVQIPTVGLNVKRGRLEEGVFEGPDVSTAPTRQSPRVSVLKHGREGPASWSLPRPVCAGRHAQRHVPQEPRAPSPASAGSRTAVSSAAPRSPPRPAAGAGVLHRGPGRAGTAPRVAPTERTHHCTR